MHNRGRRVGYFLARIEVNFSCQALLSRGFLADLPNDNAKSHQNQLVVEFWPEKKLPNKPSVANMGCDIRLSVRKSRGKQLAFIYRCCATLKMCDVSQLEKE